MILLKVYLEKAMKLKKIALMMAMILSLGVIGGCGIVGGGNSVNSSTSEDAGNTAFSSVYADEKLKTLAVNDSVTYDINKDISGKNYIKLTLKTDVQLLGEYVYVDVNDPAKVATEEFYIEASDGVKEVEFKQFLDTYRSNALGAFDKVLKSIKLTNKSGKEGKVTLLDASVSGREFPTENMMVYLEKGELKIGADLATGGTLSYLERMRYGEQTIDEVIDKNGNVVIDVNAKEDCKTHLSSSVNLVNIYDAGRQIQQSYYANVGGTMSATNGENGYTRSYCYTGSEDGWYWPYNPVQAGDCANNPGQIIDYEVTKNYIYVKVRAMDWAKGWIQKFNVPNTYVGGSTTKSYMENWYRIQNGMVVVENTFIDWNGFTNMEEVPVHTNELPATFIVHPFNNLVCYTGMFPWSNGALERHKDDLYPTTSANAVRIDNHAEDWFAWVNDNDFGVGVYVANTDYYSTSRSRITTSSENSLNKGAYSSPMVENKMLLSNKPYPTSDYTSAYVFNLSYTAPVVQWTMKTYEKMKYSYAISVDYVSVMRQQFKALYEDGGMQNEMFDEWK